MINTSTLVPTGSSRIPNWVSGGSYVIGDQSISPITLFSYIRKTNGGGVTDPSSDATNWRPFNDSATTSINTRFSAAGHSLLPVASAALAGAISSLSGSMTANTLSTVLNITNTAGVISQFTARTVDATSRTMRIVITVDGVVVHDQTSANNTTTGRGVCLAGNIDMSITASVPPIVFLSSCKIEAESSLTEAGKFNYEYIYQTRG